MCFKSCGYEKFPKLNSIKLDKMEADGTYTMAALHEQLQHSNELGTRTQKTTTKDHLEAYSREKKSKVGDCSLGLLEGQKTERNTSTLQRLYVKPSNLVRDM